MNFTVNYHMCLEEEPKVAARSQGDTFWLRFGDSSLVIFLDKKCLEPLECAIFDLKSLFEINDRRMEEIKNE